MSLGTLEREATVAAASGRATHIEPGQLLKVVDVEGGQIADLFFFNPSDPADFFSPAHTRVALEQHDLVVGESIHNNKRQPIAMVEEDTVGVHDMLLPACSSHQYLREYGLADHANCRANLFQALGEYFLRPVVVPDALHLFQRTEIAEDGTLTTSGAASKAGDYVVFRALRASSSWCPPAPSFNTSASPLRLRSDWSSTPIVGEPRSGGRMS